MRLCIKPTVRAIEGSHTACRYEFRRNPRSHSCHSFNFTNVVGSHRLRRKRSAVCLSFAWGSVNPRIYKIGCITYSQRTTYLVSPPYYVPCARRSGAPTKVRAKFVWPRPGRSISGKRVKLPEAATSKTSSGENCDTLRDW